MPRGQRSSRCPRVVRRAGGWLMTGPCGVGRSTSQPHSILLPVGPSTGDRDTAAASPAGVRARVCGGRDRDEADADQDGSDNSRCTTDVVHVISPNPWYRAAGGPVLSPLSRRQGGRRTNRCLKFLQCRHWQSPRTVANCSIIRRPRFSDSLTRGRRERGGGGI